MRRLIWYITAGAVGLFVICLGLFLLVQLSARQYMYASVADTPTTTVAMILGASVLGNGTLSPILKERVDKAIELYQAHKVQKILMTGDNGALSHNEVEPVRRYLLQAGIPPEDIFLDHAGFDTYSSMFRARDVFGITSITVVSQHFHLPRAVFIARTLGLQAFGTEAGSGETHIYNDVREVPASIKAALDLMFARVPKYLGPQFPIMGTGTTTWQ